ncbi:unnamed protein product, partial [Mesorhabditis spiculigera]
MLIRREAEKDEWKRNYPEVEGEMKFFGAYTISNAATGKFNYAQRREHLEVAARHLLVTKDGGGEPLEVTHLLVLNWPKDDCPAVELALCELLIYLRDVKSVRTLLLHDEPYTGRSDTVVLLATMIAHMDTRGERTELEAMKRETLERLRACRDGAVRTMEQFIFCCGVMQLYFWERYGEVPNDHLEFISNWSSTMRLSSRDDNLFFEIALACFGLDAAGKTTVLKMMKGESPRNVLSTNGFSLMEMGFDREYRLKVYDVGGGEKIRDIWRNYYAEVHGFIYVVDTSKSGRLQENIAILKLDKVRQPPRSVLARHSKKHQHGILDGLVVLVRQIIADYGLLNEKVQEAEARLKERQEQDRMRRKIRLAELERQREEAEEAETSKEKREIPEPRPPTTMSELHTRNEIVETVYPMPSDAKQETPKTPKTPKTPQADHFQMRPDDVASIDEEPQPGPSRISADSIDTMQGNQFGGSQLSSEVFDDIPETVKSGSMIASPPLAALARTPKNTKYDSSSPASSSSDILADAVVREQPRLPPLKRPSGLAKKRSAVHTMYNPITVDADGVETLSTKGHLNAAYQPDEESFSAKPIGSNTSLKSFQANGSLSGDRNTVSYRKQSDRVRLG